MPKRETLEEFLARGGQITKCPAQPTPSDEENKVMPTTPGGGLMSLSEGSLFYSEMKNKPKKKKAPPTINFSALPPSLLKYVKNLPS